jgi:hypothetical protein
MCTRRRPGGILTLGKGAPHEVAFLKRRGIHPICDYYITRRKRLVID